MELGLACEIVSGLAEQNGQGELEQLMEMQDALDEYTKEQRIAYRVFMEAGYRMFAPA